MRISERRTEVCLYIYMSDSSRLVTHHHFGAAAALFIGWLVGWLVGWLAQILFRNESEKEHAAVGWRTKPDSDDDDCSFAKSSVLAQL